jgi:hypothetical protein
MSHDEADIEATLDALIAVAGPAFNVDPSPYFTPSEVESLKSDAQKLWSNGHWLRMLLQDKIAASSDQEGSLTSFAQLDQCLAAIIISSFRIGAASFVHPANKRHIKSVEMQERREARARTPLRIKRDRIKKTVLPPLLAAGASPTEQIVALSNALRAEKAGDISPAGAARWRKEVLAMMGQQKPLTE